MLDDDFFELDEHFLSTIDVDNLVEAECSETKIPRCVRYFNCSGEDQLNKHTFDENSFISNNELKLIGSTSKQFFKQELFGFDLSEDVLSDPQTLQNLLAKARMNAQAMIVLSYRNNTIVMKQRCFKMRQQNTTFLFQLRHLLYTGRIKYETADTLIRSFHLYLEQLNALPIVDALHALHSLEGNETTSAAYHLLHGHLEWRWLALTIHFFNERQKSQQIIREDTILNTEFVEKLQLFIYDLIVISIAKFNKLYVIDIPTKTPFICGCVKEVWLLLQLLVEQLNDDGQQLHSFWTYFNKALNWHRELKNPYATTEKLGIRRSGVDIHPNDYTVFSLWLLNGVASLYGFTEDGFFQGNINPRLRENTELLESLLKSFIATDANEQQFRVTLLIVNSLLNNWWTQKPELVMIFWEYFHKRLNSSFFLNGADPSSLAVIGKTGTEYLEQIQRLLENDNINANMSSYSIFLNLLGKVIKRYLQNDTTNAVMKIIGRIFTKFGESKLNALSEIGIHNLQTLLLVLATTFTNQQIDQRLQSTLLQIRFERLTTPRQICLMKGHVALVLLQEKRDINVQSYLSKILDQVNKLNTDENKLPVLRIMVEILEKMCTKENMFAVGTYTIVDTWIVEYLSLSSQAEQEKCLQCIEKLLNFIGHHYLLKTRFPQEHAKVKVFLFKFILPHIKQIYRHSNVFNGVPETAATFSLNATGENGVAIFSDLFKFFTEAVVCDIQITVKYLVKVLSTDYIYRVEQVILVRLWLKCSILCTTPNEDIRRLTKLVLNLMEFRRLCPSSEADILNSKEPLSVYFATCGKMYNAANEDVKKTITEYLRLALDGFEKWIPISESPPAIFKIHITLAWVIFHCAPMVYVRSKPSCFFSVIMNHYILPLPLLMGKPQKMVSIQAVHRVWYLIVGGIENLDYQSDAQLQKVFTDLIVKWIPQFRLLPMQRVIPKPFTWVAQNCKGTTLQFVLEKMITNFLSSQRRETHQNAPITVTIIREIIIDAANQTDIIRVVLNTTVLALLEHAMMVDEHLPSRNLVFELLDILFRTPVYTSTIEIREILTSNLKILTTKNLSYYSSFYFQFMLEFVKHNSVCVANILPHLREQVEHVEKLRNAGPDAKLRNSLRQLEENIKK